MTPLYLQLLMPAAVLTAAGIAVTRLDWRRYPAWVLSMLWQVFVHGVTLSSGGYPAWALPIAAVMLAAMILEGAAKSREEIEGRIGAQAAALTLAASAAGASLLSGLSGMQRAYVARSYYLLAAAGFMVALCILRRVCPVLENHCDRIYRFGVTLWIVGIAASGAFVPGGLGYMIFPRTMATWRVVNVASYAWVILLLPIMSLAMAASAPGRKRAAKKPDGRTVTGLIVDDLRRTA